MRKKKLAKISVQYFGNSMTSGEGRLYHTLLGHGRQGELQFRWYKGLCKEISGQDVVGFFLSHRTPKNSFKSK